MLPKLLTLNARNTDAGPIFCRNRLILAKNGVSRPTKLTNCYSKRLISAKKHEKKDAVKIFDATAEPIFERLFAKL